MIWTILSKCAYPFSISPCLAEVKVSFGLTGTLSLDPAGLTSTISEKDPKYSSECTCTTTNEWSHGCQADCDLFIPLLYSSLQLFCQVRSCYFVNTLTYVSVAIANPHSWILVNRAV